MKETLLFLGSGSAFMMKALIRNLNTAGYEVVQMPVEIDSIESVQADVDGDLSIIVLFVNEELMQRRDMLMRLKRLCEGSNKRLCVVGAADDVRKCRLLLTDEVIAASFRQPLNIPEFMLQIKQLSDHGASAKKVEKMRHLLLVDDDGDYLKMVSRWLSTQYKVTIVNSGMQAITFLANNRPDLILLDYAMPVTSGPQVLEMIRSEPSGKDIPVIFLTGKDDSESVMRVLDLKPEGYILKSIDKATLLERIEDFFAQT